MFQRLLDWIFPQWKGERTISEKRAELIKALSNEVERLRGLLLNKAPTNAKRTFYVELPAFDEEDPGYIEAIAAMAKPELWFMLESLRRDVYHQIMQQGDEKLMLNAAMKAKGIELVWDRFAMFARLAKEEADSEQS